MCWGGMNDAGVNGGTAYTNENDGKQSQILSKGKQHQQEQQKVYFFMKNVCYLEL